MSGTAVWKPRSIGPTTTNIKNQGGMIALKKDLAEHGASRIEKTDEGYIVAVKNVKEDKKAMNSILYKMSSHLGEHLYYREVYFEKGYFYARVEVDMKEYIRTLNGEIHERERKIERVEEEKERVENKLERIKEMVGEYSHEGNTVKAVRGVLERTVEPRDKFRLQTIVQTLNEVEREFIKALNHEQDPKQRIIEMREARQMELEKKKNT